ncbi:serine hydrolase [Nocardioides sp.]|uniref:serine hydrolase domain-containing protein n=1 Tax=Nocardioides sp. TaxID=35761 RepID=UPI0026131BB2|nr:serine hydrolase [Nocardioides sp.]MDI6910933.1 serine hydrolase [Nocardioides sp.]
MSRIPGYGVDRAFAPGEVNLSNWQDPPWNTWGFGHISEIVPTAVVSRVAEADRVADAPMECSAEPVFAELAGATAARSVVVLRQGSLVGEWYGPGMGPTSRHALMSVSKSLCGLLIGQLVGQGLLQEDSLIGDLVPRLKSSAFKDATVRDALDMKVAVDYDETYHDPAAHVAQQDRVAGWRPRHAGDPADTYEFLTTLRQAGDHGQRLQYCSATTDALAWVVESVTGQRYHQVLSSQLWSRLPTEDDAGITVDPGGFAFANGGVTCTSRDLARLGQLVLDRGAVDGRQVVPESFVADLLAGGDTEAAAGSHFQAVHPRGSYRSQWWVTGDDHGAIYGAGIHGQYLWVDPSADVVIAKFGAHPEAVSAEALERNSAFMRWLVSQHRR